MTFKEYKKKVVDEALKHHDGPICCDTVKESFETSKSIEKAAERAIDDTLYWEGDFFPRSKG